MPRISKHPERFSARKRQTRPTLSKHSCINTASSLPSRERELVQNIHSHTRTFSLVPFTNDERRDTRLFYELEERDAAGEREKKLADFLASDVASPTL